MAGRLLIGKDWGKEASKHSPSHIYLRTSIKSMTEDFLLLFQIKARLAEVCGILRGFFPKSKDYTDQPNCEPDHKPLISHLTAANVTQKNPAQPQHRAPRWPAPRRAWAESCWIVEEVTAGAIPGGKKCKKFGRLGLILAMRLLQNTPQTQVPGLHKEKHYLVDILTVYFDIYVTKKNRSCNPHLSMKKACSGSLGSTSQLREVINSHEHKNRFVIYFLFNLISVVVIQSVG